MLLNINVMLDRQCQYKVFDAPTTQIKKDIIALSAYWTDIIIQGNYDKRTDTFEIYDIYNNVSGYYESKQSILDAYYHAGAPRSLKIHNH